eukprot:9478392-Alexandrium_andersonii.AAC.1
MPLVKATPALNNSLVKVEKVSRFHREEAAAPRRHAGRNVLVPRSESAELGDPTVTEWVAEFRGC